MKTRCQTPADHGNRARAVPNAPYLYGSEREGTRRSKSAFSTSGAGGVSC